VSTTKQPVKQTKAAKKPPVPDPDYYLTDLPPEKGRANIKIEIDGKGTAQASVPAKHLNSFTGLTVGLSAVAAPVVALGIACYAGLPVAAIVTLTAMVPGISLLALLLLFYMLHKGDPSKSK
jgi:hypothetical protein